MQTEALTGGFAAAPTEAALAFRAVMRAMAGAVDTPMVRDWITFHTGAPLVDRPRAMFALGPWSALLPLAD